VNKQQFRVKDGWTRKELEECLISGSVLGPMPDIDGEDCYVFSDDAVINNNRFNEYIPAEDRDEAV
jgi:hypothetical protein